MKTILKILVILLVAGIVAGGIYAVVENTTLLSSILEEGRPPSAVQDTASQSSQPMERPEGDGEHSASLVRGLTSVLITLAKLTVISIFVLFVPKVFSLPGRHR